MDFVDEPQLFSETGSIDEVLEELDKAGADDDIPVPRATMNRVHRKDVENDVQRDAATRPCLCESLADRQISSCATA